MDHLDCLLDQRKLVPISILERCIENHIKKTAQEKNAQRNGMLNWNSTSAKTDKNRSGIVHQAPR